MARLGLYIHYPYCRRRCDYCDFAITVAGPSGPPNGNYTDALIAELRSRARAFRNREMVSIYIGGGTPSLWPVDHLARVLDAARKELGAASVSEVTLEANPIDCTELALARWKQAGITRLSIGVQSVAPSELAVLGRDHSMGDGPPAVVRALGAGFAHVSVDVIIGTPRSASAGLQSLETIAALGSDHLSVYELTFEDNAPLGRAAARGEITPKGDDELATLYRQAHDLLGELGFEHYEISSYAKPGARAIHNSLYWEGSEYLGIGASAASYRRAPDGSAVRETNLRSAARYLAAPADGTTESSDAITAEDADRERLWLSLRTSDGASETAFARWPELATWLISSQLATRDAGRIRPTLKGFLFADQIAARIVSYP